MPKRRRVISGPRQPATCKKTKMMTQEESAGLFRQYLLRKEAHEHADLNQQAQNLQKSMVNTKVAQSDANALRAMPLALGWSSQNPREQQQQQQLQQQQLILREQGQAHTGALTTRKLSLLTSTTEAPMHSTGLRTVAQGLGLRFKSLQGLQHRAEVQSQEKSVRAGQEYGTRRQVSINLAQGQVLSRLFQDLCVQALHELPPEYTLPPRGGMPDEDPDHDCLRSDRNRLPCNMVSVHMPSDGVGGRLHFCTVTGQPHFCSRLTCEYFTRMKRSSYDTCPLTGACFQQLPSSGMSYLAYRPSMRRGQQQRDDEEFDMPQYISNRDTLQQQSRGLRDIVAGLKRKEQKTQRLQRMQKERLEKEQRQPQKARDTSPSVLTPQMARQWDQKLHGGEEELPTAERVHCAVHANIQNQSLKSERLETFRQEVLRIITFYYKIKKYTESQVDELVDICEKTWVLITASETYMKQTMSYRVERHPYVVVDYCASRGYQSSIQYEQPCAEEEGVIEVIVEELTLIPKRQWLCMHYVALVSITTSRQKDRVVHSAPLSKRFRAYVRALTKDEKHHSILRALHASYEEAKHN